MPPIPPGCIEEQRFQEFVSTPPVTNYTSNGVIINLFDTDSMRKHIQFIKDTHVLFFTNDRNDEDLKDFRRVYRNRVFYRVIKQEAHHNLITREHGFDEEETEPRGRAAYRDSKKALNDWFTEVDRLHRAVKGCFPNVTAQLMGEQLYRQSNLVPDVMKNVMEFANAKDPKRIVMDADANRGVTMPRGGRRTRRTKRRGTSRAARR